MSNLPERKRLLLIESDINRQVLLLEAEQLRSHLDHLRDGFTGARWKWLVPLAGIVAAWRFKKFGGLFKSGLGLLILRKTWDAFMARK